MQVDISNNTIDAGRGGIVVLNGNQVRIVNNAIVGTTTYKWYGIVVEAIKTGAQISRQSDRQRQVGHRLVRGLGK